MFRFGFFTLAPLDDNINHEWFLGCKDPHFQDHRSFNGGWVLICFENLDVFWLGLPPWKINMEHSNHPFRKENDLPNLQDYGPC